MDEQSETEDQSEGGGPSINWEVLSAYLRTARRALKVRRGLIALLAVAGLAMTIVVTVYWPKTYSCTTSLMAVENAVLDGNSGSRPLAAAESLLMRHENLEQVIKDTNLLETDAQRRPFVLRIKDKLIKLLVGPLDRKARTLIMVQTLEAKMKINVKESVLEITIEWSDPETTAALAEALKDEFLKLRHYAEVSAFQDKIGIFDTHSAQMREEIAALAEQMKSTLAARAADATGEPAKPGAPRRTVVRTTRPKVVVDEVAADNKKKLADARQRLAQEEGARAARMAAEQAKLDELKLKFTPSHPQVITQQERLANAADVPPSLAVLRSEVADLEGLAKQREGLAETSQSVTAVTTEARAAASTVPLSTDVLKLLEREDVDPALGAQMSTAVLRYSSLMNDVRGAKLALDTAQAAFKHRYQIVLPVEIPEAPIRPKPWLIVLGGLVISLLLSLLVPIVLELRRGVLEDRWQIEKLQLPVLGELHLPAKKT